LLDQDPNTGDLFAISSSFRVEVPIQGSFIDCSRVIGVCVAGANHTASQVKARWAATKSSDSDHKGPQPPEQRLSDGFDKAREGVIPYYLDKGKTQDQAKALAEAELEKAMLKELAEGNF
jgi:hypothetical protein